MMSETSERTGDEASATKPKDGSSPRKKRKKKAKAREGVPTFAQRFPRDETLDALLVAFERGNYARVREGAQKLAASTKLPAVREAAEELLRRLEPDPLARYLLGAASLLLVFFSIWYFTHRLTP
jgi:hypothetical protein